MFHSDHTYDPYPRRMICGTFAFVQDTPARAAAIAVVSSVPGDEAVRQRPPPFSGRQNEGCPSPRGATARSEPAPTRPNHTPRNMQQKRGHLDTHGLPGTDDSLGQYSAIVPPPSGPGAMPRTSRSEGDGVLCPVTHSSAVIPSAVCTVAGGVAATCVSPRSNLGGCARQLEVATQYLNRSLVVPSRPQQQNNNIGRMRPATAEAARAGRGVLAEPGCNIGEFRPQTTPARPRERRRNHTSFDGRSNSPDGGGNYRYHDANASSGLSWRPLVSTRTAVGRGESPSTRSASKSQSPRGPVVVVSSPRIEQPEKLLARNASSLTLEAPRGARVISPWRSSCRQNAASGGFDTGVNSIGEVGYTISSAAAVGGYASGEKARSATPADGNGVQMGLLNETEFVVPSPSTPSVQPHRSATGAATAAVPKLQLGRLPGSLGV